MNVLLSNRIESTKVVFFMLGNKAKKMFKETKIQPFLILSGILVKVNGAWKKILSRLKKVKYKMLVVENVVESLDSYFLVVSRVFYRRIYEAVCTFRNCFVYWLLGCISVQFSFQSVNKVVNFVCCYK